MANFITNSGDASLKARIVTLIQESTELKFLVGFFYFSGINELYESLKNNQDTILKILVGLNVDKDIQNFQEYADKKNKSKADIAEDFHESVINAVNQEIFDNAEFYEQALFLVDMIVANRLIIRKTLNPNHAKLYIFRLNERQVGRNRMFITGSSNLTKMGLSEQEEFNVEIGDYGVEEAENYFDELWNQSVPITEDDIRKKRLLDTLNNDTHLKSIDPFSAYMYVVKTWLDTFSQMSITSLQSIMEKAKFTPYKYQMDAVRQALDVIKKHNGVIVADVVGLGKTVIACLIGRMLPKRGLILCPPGLIGDDEATSGWNHYLNKFGITHWEVRSSGNLESVTKLLSNVDDIDVVIIDEAHRFRNDDTESYEMLKNICRDKTVILLTATPFNNTPSDILSMLSLFIKPKQSTITLNPNLKARFASYSYLFKILSEINKYHDSSDPVKKSKAEKLYNEEIGDLPIDMSKVKAKAQYLAHQIRDVLEPVTIRRNRLDLMKDPDYSDEINSLSKLEDPEEWFFALTHEQSKFYDKVISVYFGDDEDKPRFKGPLYQPYVYKDAPKTERKLTSSEQRAEIAQTNLYKIIRRQLVKRFESSFGAFRDSMHNFKKNYMTIREFIRKSNGNYILDRNWIKKLNLDDADDLLDEIKKYTDSLEDEKLKDKLVYDTNSFFNRQAFFDDIDSDIKLFDDIIIELDKLKLVDNDPKKACLIKHIYKFMDKKPTHNNPKPKLIVFSEYADTVHYLKDDIESNFNNRVLVISGTLGKDKLHKINSNFDAAFKHPENDYDILLSTDKLSEGFNLNRAAMVVNYDIPWNPVRVIQRVGRINRISKKVFESIYIANFFPTERGADIVKSREIAQHKMFLIHSTLGEDAKIFDVAEEPTASGLYQKLQQNPYEQEQESLYTRLKNLFRLWEEQYPDRVQALKRYPNRLKTAKEYKENNVMLFIRKGRLYSILNVPQNKPEEIPFEEAIEYVKCDENTNKLILSKQFWDIYHTTIKNAGEIAYKEGSQSLDQKAKNMLSSIRDNCPDDLSVLLPFVLLLLKDIDEYGTLPDYTLKTIAAWDNLWNKKDYFNLEKAIVSLNDSLGVKYNKENLSRNQNEPKEIIVAIENRGNENE